MYEQANHITNSRRFALLLLLPTITGFEIAEWRLCSFHAPVFKHVEEGLMKGSCMNNAKHDQSAS